MLRRPPAYVQAAYHIAHRAGLALLYECGRVESGSAQYLCIEGAAEEATIVDCGLWPEQQGTLDAQNRGDVYEASSQRGR